MSRFALFTVLFASAFGCPWQLAAANPEKTVREAATVLNEIMEIPLQQIPASLLADAEAVAIFPRLIKIGFIGGVEHGQGVVMIRGDDRSWSQPRLLSITGGSVGWQIGAQATDLVLVFKTRKSVENLLDGKFKIGADVSAAAGPVGRRAEAATDGQLQAEIYSYSRTRGLFAGASIDGAVLQTNAEAEAGFYRSGQMPQSAVKLMETLMSYAGSGGAEVAVAPDQPQQQQPGRAGQTTTPRSQLAASAGVLYPLIADDWKRYLALPTEVYADGRQPSREAVFTTLERYDRVAADPQYKNLSGRAEFQRVHQYLKRYAASLGDSQVTLPPPPQSQPSFAVPK